MTMDEHGVQISEGCGRPITQVALDSSLHVFDVDLLKIDTDGCNLAVLQGAKQILKRTQFVLIEIEAGGSENMYQDFFLMNEWKKKRLSPDDLLFSRY